MDGQLARRLGQVSTVGKVLDPLADRVLVGVAIVSGLVQGDLPRWLAVAVLVREVLVSAAVLLIGALGDTHVDVLWMGKVATFALMSTLPLFLAGHSGVSWAPVAERFAWVAALPGLVLTWAVVPRYVPRAWRALAAGRVGRTA